MCKIFAKDKHDLTGFADVVMEELYFTHYWHDCTPDNSQECY